MKMRKSKNKKILEAASEVIEEKERQKLLEKAELHFKSEWDALCFELEHPSPEFVAAGKAAREAYLKTKDDDQIETIHIIL